MERKTKIRAEEGRHDLVITREFELPVELLFRAYEEPELVEQWMGTRVLKLENRRHGGWQFENRDAQGAVVFRSHGVFHEFSPNEKITRTFEMEGTPFPVQLEFLEFEALTEDTSRLTMHIVYKSVAAREQMLRLPFAEGLNGAHNRLEAVLSKVK
ncbi:MAG TPA: SRPBCC domain-containing protein [Chitinophagaceae bacterium]|jgi:uncharacterized protein YndB with AHSA1/START domain|nr:SRPBCC domain-containing protein [Chitinophagaceae bacterium]